MLISLCRPGVQRGTKEERSSSLQIPEMTTKVVLGP